MRISLNWLKDYITIPKNVSPKKLAELFTMKTAEVEGVTEETELLNKVLVGQVVKLTPHPNADKLKIAKTSVGKKTLNIVCGGSNLKEGMYVAVALIGAKVKWHGEEELVELKPIKIRGVESEGMICATNEIGFGECEGGEIMDLTPLKPKIGQPLAKLFKKDDVIFEIENKSLTHRPDLWGHYGIAREFAALLGTKFKKLEPKVQIPKIGEQVKVEVRNKTLCPRYCGVIIENIKIAESPEWLRKRVEAVGMRSINNIVDTTNFVLAELGQPLHAFDKNYIKGGIAVRTAKEGEKMTTLDGEKRTLKKDMLVIADCEKPVALAGIMGGENSGVLEETTSIIIESANFNAANIRRTSQKLGLHTESAQRFEKGLDPCLPELGIKRACELILELCPHARIAGPITDMKSFTKKELVIDLNLPRVHSKIGIKIPEREIKKYLAALEFKVGKKGENLRVKVPAFRAVRDIETEDDLIEEIARLHGYDEIPEELPHLPIRLPEENTERVLKHKVRDILSLGLGFTEVSSYSLYGRGDFIKCGLPEELHVALDNYLSEDQSHMRVSLAPNLLKTIAKNLRFFDEFKIYEIGRTYENLQEYFPKEEKKIAGAVVSKKENVFHTAKGALETLLKRYGAPRLELGKGRSFRPYAHPAKYAEYVNGEGAPAARVFELHPQTAKNFGLEDAHIGMFEVNFTELVKLGRIIENYEPLPRFPAIDIDISVIIDKTKEAAKVEKIIKESGPDLISKVELFDTYEGGEIEKNKKSMAFRITLQAKDRTLTDEDMVKVQNKIFQNLKYAGGKIRGLK